MNNWDWEVFLQDPGGKDPTYLEWMISSWGWTLAISFSALIIALLLGSIIGVIRTLPQSPILVRFGNAWVECFRNIPLLVQVFLWYHVAPEFFGILHNVPPFTLVVIALGLFTSARIAEQVKTGIKNLPRGQREAGMALGLTTSQCYRYIILPRAYRSIIPTLTSEAMGIFKNSSVAFAVSISELTQFYLQSGEETARQTEIFLAVVTMYTLSALVINLFMSYLEKRLVIPGNTRHFGGLTNK